MTGARLLPPAARGIGPAHGREALALARRLPDLCASARDAASSVLHGAHGRRRAGVGEAFWQFRPFVSGEPVGRIDWRRSARDDRTYVREREWEAAQTLWLWMDRSASMAFMSDLARQSKLDRALVLGLAAADLFVRGGERVGLLGLTRALATRGIVERLAEALMRSPGTADAELPAPVPLPARSRGILVGDWLCPAGDFAAMLRALSAEGATGHVVAVADPVEEGFPFAGHVEFADVDSAARLRLGEASAVRDTYLGRLAAHREALAAACRRLGWSFGVHRTDRPASEALLRLAVLCADARPAPGAGPAPGGP